MQKILYVYIPPKKFHIIFLRKFSHAFSQFHQKSRFIGYLLHSSCYFIEYYYYYYHQKKKFFLGTSHSHSKCVAWFVSLLCSDSIERLTVFTQSCLKHLCISLSKAACHFFRAKVWTSFCLPNELSQTVY